MPYSDPEVRKAYHKKKSREWKEENRDRWRENQRRHRFNNREKYNSYMRKWRSENKERVKQNFKSWKEKNPDYYYRLDVRKRSLVNSARARAKRLGVPFSITIEDIEWLEYCPVLGMKLDYKNRGKAVPSSATLDRTHPERGYVTGNVVIMSHRANVLKRDATFEELKAIGRYSEKMEAVYSQA